MNRIPLHIVAKKVVDVCFFDFVYYFCPETLNSFFMKQIVIRILGPQLPVFDFVYGEISKGQFVPHDVDSLPLTIRSCVHVSDLLGTQAYVEVSKLGDLFKVLLDFFPEVSFYPNFIVFTSPDHEKSQETQETQETA